MHSHLLALYTTLVAFGVAKPTTSPPTPPPFFPVPGGSTDYLSTFDDLDPVLGLLAIQEVGPYNGLDFDLILISTGVNGAILLGVEPPSKPNVAAYAINVPNPKMTTQYSGSVTDTFDFKSFYAGCVANTQETAASVATSCTILVQGYRASELKATQKVKFDVGLLALKAPMKQFKLNKDFKDLDTVTFNTEYQLVTELLGATLLDNLEYTVHYPKEIGKGYGKGKEQEAPKA